MSPTIEEARESKVPSGAESAAGPAGAPERPAPPPRSILSLLELPDAVTLLGAAAGIVAIGAALEGAPRLAGALLLLSVLCDRFDGKIARWIGRKHKVFGEELDNLSDAVCFGVSPAAFGYALGLTSPLEVALLVAFALAGILRLARFACLKLDGVHYAGMPITYNGVLLPLAFVATDSLAVPFAKARFIFLAVYAVSAILMTSSIRWRKI